MGYTNFSGKDRDALGDKSFESEKKLAPEDKQLAPQLDKAIKDLKKEVEILKGKVG